VNTPAFWAMETDDDEEFEGFGDEDEMTNGHLDLDQEYEEDSGDDDDDDDDDDMDEDEDEDEEDDQEVSHNGREAVERLKDDLFAEEDSEEESGEGEPDGFNCGLSLNVVCRPHESSETHGGFEGADHSPGGGKCCSQKVDPRWRSERSKPTSELTTRGRS